ncbi:MAG TPA: phenylalanine--tRNA ligase subunit beta [Nitrospirae bacterium]|nr:phenylalanine--tRNA ligase subunit beta [Nitrospirota bacterium]
MKISVNWLKDYANFNTPIDDLVQRLTMCGLEVEAVENVNDDTIIDINVTPNRQDCLSHLGIAREISVLYDCQFKYPEHDFIAENTELDFNVDIINTQLCHRYAGRIVKGVKIAPSPKWMQERLMNCGIRAINNVVDITNYVLLEFGHPLHAFDLNKLKGKKILVATAGEVTKTLEPLKIRLLDNSERILQDQMLLINDADSPIALAGIMGGSTSEVTEETRDIFIESAWFLPQSIRNTSRILGIKTESSYRFERGADIKILKKALDRAAYLMKELCGCTIHGKIDIYPKRFKQQKIKLSFDKINRYIGMEIPKKEVLRILSALTFEIECSEDELTVKVPSSRCDVTRDVDVIEEVLRIYGYDKVPSLLPVAPIKIHSQDSEAKKVTYKIIKKCRELLLNEGFNEAINYSFLGPQDFDLFNINNEDIQRNTINILNPLNSEDSMMRTMLIPSLIRNLVYNISRGNKDIRIFEIARTFLKTEDKQLPIEERHISILLCQDKEKYLYKDNVEDFYILKGVIEKLLKNIGIDEIHFERSKEFFLHQGRSADLFIKTHENNKFMKIGYFGVLSPQVIQKLSVKILKQEVLAAELLLDKIINNLMFKKITFLPIAQFPFIERDSAVVVDDTLELSKIVNLLNSCKDSISNLIEEVAIFDIYKGKGIEDGKKSVAFNIRYRSTDKTLSDEEVDTIHKKVLSEVLPKIEGKIRS